MSISLDTHSQDDGKYYATASGAKVSNPESTINLKQMECFSYVQPRVAPPTTSLTTANNTIWEFEIPGGSGAIPHYLHDHVLQFQLNNADAANVMGLVDGIMMIQQLDTLINDTVVKTQYPQQMRNTLILGHITEQLPNKLAQVGIDPTTFAANLSIPVSSSVTVRVPFQSLLTTSSFPMWTDRARIKFRFTMYGGASLIRTGTATAASLSVTASSVQLNLMGHRMRPDVLAEHDRLLKASPKTFKFLNATQVKQGLATTANVPATTNFTPSGMLSHYFVQLTPAVPTGVQLYDSYAITSFDLLKNGVVLGSFMGDNGLLTAMLNDLADNYWLNTNPLLQRNLYYFSFSEKPLEDINGGNNGSVTITGQSETIRIVTTTTDATAQAVITCMFQAWVTVDFASGQLVVQRNPIS